jgi:ribosomal protein S18 acetylase RimI-like enzyme
METSNYELVFVWEEYAKQFPINGKGIKKFNTWLDDEWLYFLLYYGNDSKLWGFLQYYPENIERQDKASITIQVRPDKRKRGIATKLLDKAIKIFPIDLSEQDYTTLGEAFINRYLEKKGKYKNS